MLEGFHLFNSVKNESACDWESGFIYNNVKMGNFTFTLVAENSDMCCKHEKEV